MQIKEFTPPTGFNVVAVDSYEKPGKALYLVGHFDDEDKAESARSAHEKKTRDISYIYSAKRVK